MSKKPRFVKKLISCLLMFTLIILPGCWNYREINTMAIVVGCAIDKNENDDYIVTVEIMNPVSKGKEAELEPVILGMEGETIFDAIRNLITRVGKKLYWSHAKVFIISEKIAQDGIIPVLDWVFRDAEVRPDVAFFISREKTAYEILHSDAQIDRSVSMQLDSTFRNQPPVSDFVELELWRLIKNIQEEGIICTAATIQLIDYAGKKIPQVYGTAVLRDTKMVGWLNGADSKIVSWIVGRKEQGLIIIQDTPLGGKVVYEVSDMRVTTTVAEGDDELVLKLHAATDVAIAELQRQVSYQDKAMIEKMEKDLEEYLTRRMRDVVSMVQKEYQSDIFGFGKAIKNKNPKLWRKYKERWESEFAKMQVEYTADAQISGSALVAKPIRQEE